MSFSEGICQNRFRGGTVYTIFTSVQRGITPEDSQPHKLNLTVICNSDYLLSSKVALLNTTAIEYDCEVFPAYFEQLKTLLEN